MNLESLKLNRLAETSIFTDFDCGDEDLNDFLLTNSRDYQKSLLAVTYLLEGDSKTVAFFSLLNDKISYEDTDSQTFWKKHIRREAASY